MRKKKNGRAYMIPIMRPIRRWNHSQKKIYLKSETSIQKFSFLNSGDFLYRSKTRSHSASLSGGSVPIMGRHSTIDRPEPLRRVMAPMIIMQNTAAQQVKSHVTIIFICLSVMLLVVVLWSS